MTRGSCTGIARAMGSMVLAAGWLLASAADAEPARPDPKIEAQAAFEAAAKAAQKGPLAVPLASQASLQIPQGFAFIPLAEARRLMKAFGNSVDSGFQGLVVPHADDHSFSFYDVTYYPTGYIKDDDAKSWDADKLLEQVREGTAEENKHRHEMGISEIEVTGWIERPSYDAASHQLVWSIGAREKGATPGEDDGVNYKTLVLGRQGYVSMNLVTDNAHIAALRPLTGTLLGGLKFDDSKRYVDFNSSTDHVAEFGLAALVAGVAAKKLGLLALAVAFVLKFAKIIGIAAIGVLVALRKWLGLRSRRASASAAPVQTPPGPAP